MHRSFLRAIQRTLRTSLGCQGYEFLRAAIAKGGWPNLSRPETFNEHLSYRKLFAPPAEAPVVSDKYRVREYVRERVGGDILTALLAVVDDPAHLDRDQIEGPFVCKATHGSGQYFVEFVEDRSALDWPKFERRARQMLKRDFGWLSNEPWYRDVPRRLIVEPLLVDRQFGTPLDFKFFTFHGKVQLIQVDAGRRTNQRRGLYLPDWTPANLRINRYPQAEPIGQPSLLGEMTAIAETLGKGFDFVRVDLYCLDDRVIRFGELTLAPNGGWTRFYPGSWDASLGALWRDPDCGLEAVDTMR